MLVLALSNLLPVSLCIPGWPPTWSHSASTSQVLDHSCVPPCLALGSMLLLFSVLMDSYRGMYAWRLFAHRIGTFLSCTSISVYCLELRLFLFVHQICLPLLIPRWWSSQPTLWVVPSPTCMPCKATWTCSELLSQLWDIIVNMLSSLLHLNQVKGFILNSNDGPDHQYNCYCWFKKKKKPKHCGK